MRLTEERNHLLFRIGQQNFIGRSHIIV